ncbi:MAG: RloB domain-containing protein [Planctomycetota bacterium]
MPKRCSRVAAKSTLIVVEGEGEEALCLHLKACIPREAHLRVVVKNAHGGSPNKQVDKLKQLSNQIDYDQLVLVVDHDLPMTKTRQAWLKKNTVKVICSDPCLEGEWLRLHGEQPDAESKKCQQQAARYAKLDGVKAMKSMLADRKHWGTKFPIQTLRSQCDEHPWLKTLLSVFEP